MTDELKSCPFCGGKAHVAELDRWHAMPLYYVICEHDGCRAGYDYCLGGCVTRKEAIELWNRRAQ